MKSLVIDISKWDNFPDFKQWKNRRNLWGVIIKAGGNETNLGRYSDSTFERNYKNAKAAGLHVGSYYYTVSTTVEAAKKDAEHFAGLLAGHDFDLPVYIDVEDPRQFQLSKRTLTDIIKTFCDVLNDKGYIGGVYTGGAAWSNNVYKEELFKYANWIAWWRKNWPTEAGDIGMWQQGGIRLSDGDIVYDDKSGYTDCNWCVVDYPARINGTEKKEETKTEETKKEETKKETTPATGTVEALMKIAYDDLGYYAPNDPERGSKAGRYCAKLMGEDWLAGPSTEIWWCCMWVSMILDMAKVPCPGFPSQNTDIAWNGGAKTRAVSKENIRRGDILIFDWNFNTTATDHIGFATGSPKNGYVTTIEGNVGNAVQEKNRALSTIRYVIRPKYADAAAAGTSTDKTDIKNPSQNGKKLDVDGAAGYNTIYEWQAQLGTYKDGKISGQDRNNYKYFESIVSVSFEENGSQLVEAIQKKVGASVDGIWGYETSKKIQEWLIKKKYTVGETGADGYFGNESVKGLQRSLNAGAWK